MATASRVKRSQAEIWTFAEQWHPGALDFKMCFCMKCMKCMEFMMHGSLRTSSISRALSTKGWRECFLKQWNTETVAVLCSITWCSKIHKFLMQVKSIETVFNDSINFHQFTSILGRSSQTGRSWWDFVTSPMYWAVLILSNVSPRSAIPSTQSWWWMPVKVCFCHVFLPYLVQRMWWLEMSVDVKSESRTAWSDLWSVWNPTR